MSVEIRRNRDLTIIPELREANSLLHFTVQGPLVVGVELPDIRERDGEGPCPLLNVNGVKDGRGANRNRDWHVLSRK